MAVISAARSKDTYYSAKYRRITNRRGPMKAIVALEHSMLIAAWHMLTNGAFYREPGADYFSQRQPHGPKRAPSPSSRPSATRSPSNPTRQPHSQPTEVRRASTSRRSSARVTYFHVRKVLQICMVLVPQQDLSFQLRGPFSKIKTP